MTVNRERLARLMDHGLTEYEGRAYLALLDLEMAEASQVSEVARVPRTKIYQALDDLEGKRLVKVIPERPKRYVVQPITRYISELEAGYREKAKRLEAQKSELAEEFAPRGGVTPTATGSFLAIKGRSNVVSRTLEAAGRAEASITVVTSAEGAKRLHYHAHLLRERAEAGVRVRVLAPATEANREAMEALAEFATVRHARVNPGPVTLFVVDGSEAILSHHSPDDFHVFQGQDPAIWTDDGALVGLMNALVAGAWTLATPLAQWDGAEAPVDVAGELDLGSQLLQTVQAAGATEAAAAV